MFSLLGLFLLGLFLLGLFLYFVRCRYDAYLFEQLFHYHEAFDNFSKAWTFFGIGIRAVLDQVLEKTRAIGWDIMD